MPMKSYFKGHGGDVMAGMKKTYGKRAKEMFYKTANAKGMKPPKSKMPKGMSLSPMGDLGYARQEEALKIGTFKGVVCRHMDTDLPVRPVRKARD